jgi:hypothetical protein
MGGYGQSQRGQKGGGVALPSSIHRQFLLVFVTKL